MDLIASARAEFSPAVWDNVEENYVAISGQTVGREVDFDASILLTIAGDVSGPINALEVHNVEVVEAINEVDFDEIEI